MVKLKKKKIQEAEIPTSSMADIAFLLLLFFLVATVIDVDTGIGLALPEYIPPEEQEIAPLSKDRMAALLINENGDVLMNKEAISIPEIKDKLKERLRSKIDLPKNKKLVVSVKTDRKTNYNLYIQALDQVKAAYFETWEEYSQQIYNLPYKKIDEDQLKVVKDHIPMIISIAEPEMVNK